MTSKLSSISVDKSRTLLTVGFNLRTRNTLYAHQSPAGTALWNGDFVSSLRDFGGRVFSLIRRLKPPVNKVSSLRDFSPLTQHYYKLFIFYPLIVNSE